MAAQFLFSRQHDQGPLDSKLRKIQDNLRNLRRASSLAEDYLQMITSGTLSVEDQETYSDDILFTGNSDS
jgi:hypothetical protein